MKILILASNPRGDLKLNEEIRDLQGVIERSRNREQLEVEVGLAVRPGDLQELLLKHNPEVVHFCGHGTGEQGLVLQNDAGREQLVSTDALSNLFELFSEQVGCILLNACYSEIQANAMIQHINYVIGMSQEIRDDAAIAFATGFYRALGYGRSIELSYKFGCSQIQLSIPSSGNSVSRSVVSEEERKLEVVDIVERIVIPEHLKPILKKKANLTIISNSAVSKADDNISRPQQVEVQIDIDRAFGKEIALKQYREKVREFLADRKLTNFENIQIDLLKEELGLSDEEAEKILEEEQAPIRQAQQAYKKMLTVLIGRGFYPLNDEIKNDLKRFQAEKNLTDEEVEQISKPILEAAEVKHQGKLRQQYEQEFKQVIEAGYPIDEVARDGLKNLQQSLGLSDENVASIEQPIIAPKEAEYQQRLEAETLRQEQQKAKYENNLRQYEQAFSNAVMAEYPLNQSVQEQLKSLQQSLGLKGKDITLIQQLILEQAEARYPKKPREHDTDDLRSEKGVDYTQLRDLLKAQQWKEADQETLDAMLKAAGRVSEGWLGSQSMENFPCTDLRTIDQLWVKYSKGHFGFSVQKRIFDSVNRKMGDFGERIGWRGKAGIFGGFFAWKTPLEITFALEAPKGHLPWRWFGGLGGSMGDQVGWSETGSFLYLSFSRVETCKV